MSRVTTLLRRLRPTPGVAPVGVLFLVNAMMWTSIGPRLAEIAERLGMSEGALGGALLLQAIGLIAATLFGPLMARRFGLRRMAIASGVAYCLATALPGYAGTWLLLAGACLISGIANAPLDLAQNGMAVELGRRTKRELLPRFEVWFNIGSLSAVLLATVTADVIGVGPYLTLVGLAGAATILLVARKLPDDVRAKDVEPPLRELVRSIPRGDRWRVVALSAVAAAGLWAELMIPDWSSLLFAQEFDAEGSARGWGAVAFTAGLLISLWSISWLRKLVSPQRLVVGGAVVFGQAMSVLPTAQSIPVACGILFLAGVGIAPTHPLALSATGLMAAKEVVLPIVIMAGYVGLTIQRPINGGLAEAFTLSKALMISGIVVTVVVLACSWAFSRDVLAEQDEAADAGEADAGEPRDDR